MYIPGMPAAMTTGHILSKVVYLSLNLTGGLGHTTMIRTALSRSSPGHKTFRWQTGRGRRAPC